MQCGVDAQAVVGVVTGDYEYTPKPPAGVREDYVNKLPVRWLVTGINFNNEAAPPL